MAITHRGKTQSAVERRELVKQDARPGGKRGGLDGDGHKSGDWCGRAFIDVRHPEMKRHGADLECEADQQEKPAADQIKRPIAWLFDEKVGDQIEVRRASGTVDQSDAIEEKPRGKSAHDKILHRRFAGASARAPHAGQHVNRDGHGFQTEKENQQIVGGGHDYHADGREKNQRVKFAFMDTGLAQIIDRRENRERGRQQKNQRKIKRKAIEDNTLVKGAFLSAPKQESLGDGKTDAEQTDKRQVTLGLMFVDK